MLPVTNVCPNHEIPTLSGGTNNSEIPENNGKFIKTEFYASVGLGFAVGFWGTLACYY